MQLIKNPESLVILTMLTDDLDWDDKEIYCDTLRKYGYYVEASELESLDVGDFYDILHLFLSEFKPNFIH